MGGVVLRIMVKKVGIGFCRLWGFGLVDHFI